MSYEKSIALEKQKRIFKIIVIGDSSVGKTCLTYRFCGGKFPMKTEATIGVDFRERQVEVDNETIKLSFWDTAGQEKFRSGMPPNFYRRVHVVLFVYDITCYKTFENLHTWMKEWKSFRTTDLNSKLYLIGNKCEDEMRREVSRTEATHFAQSHDMVYFEISAQTEKDSRFVRLVEKFANRARAVELPPASPKLISLKTKPVKSNKSSRWCC